MPLFRCKRAHPGTCFQARLTSALQLLLTCFLLGHGLSALAQSSPSSTTSITPIDREGVGFLAEIRVHSPEEVEKALKRAEQLFERGAIGDETGPATFILHGPEVALFFKENYQKYKAIVDLAARLSAFEIVDIKVCEVQLGLLGLDQQSIFPFVETVPYGPGEVDRLLEERYRYF